jgi:hypothetical protein
MPGWSKTSESTGSGSNRRRSVITVLSMEVGVARLFRKSLCNLIPRIQRLLQRKVRFDSLPYLVQSETEFTARTPWSPAPRVVRPRGEPAAGVIEELRKNDRGVRQPCMSSDAHRRNGPTTSLARRLFRMAIQRAEAQTPTPTKLAAAYTAAHEFRHQLLNFRAGASLGR